MSLEPIKNNISKYKVKSNLDLDNIKVIKNYFKQNYKTNINIKKLSNNNLTIQVSSAGLAANIRLDNIVIIKDLNQLKIGKVNRLNINIG